MIVLVGASATGKTEIGKILDEAYGIKKVITYTTRPMRAHEINHHDYHFISKEEFLKLKGNSYFFETMEYNGNYYGTSRDSLNSKSYVILDPKGLSKYINSSLDIISFYLECSEEIRMERMKSRGDSIENIKQRIEVDGMVFNESLKDIVTYTIDVSDKSLLSIAKTIYEKGVNK